MGEATRDLLATVFVITIAVVFTIIVADVATSPRGSDCVYVQVVDCVCDSNPCECESTPDFVLVCDDP